MVFTAVAVAVAVPPVVAFKAVHSAAATEPEEEWRLGHVDHGLHSRRLLRAEVAGGFPLVDLLGEGGADRRIDGGLVAPQLARQGGDEAVVGLCPLRLEIDPCPCAVWAGASAAGGVASWANTSGIAGAPPMMSPKPSAVAPIVVNNPRGVMLPPLARVGRFSGAAAVRPRLG